jgi:hypothetical protein
MDRNEPGVADAMNAGRLFARFHRVNRLGRIAMAATLLLIVTVGGIVGLGAVARPGPGHYLVANAMGRLTVRDALTGKVTATVQPPDGGDWGDVSAVTDPHVYLVVHQLPRLGQATLYRLTIDDDGRVRALTPAQDLPPDVGAPGSLAVSPDGTRIALLRGGAQANLPVEIDVMTGSGERPAVFRASKISSAFGLSWGTDGRHLAFVFRAEHAYSVRVLDTQAGPDLLKSAPPVFSGGAADVPYTTPVLGKDGRTMYLIADDRTGGRRTTQVIEVDLRTGRRLRTLYEQPLDARYGNVGWGFTILVRDRAGTALIAVDPQGRGHRIDIASGRVTTIPSALGSPVAW